MAAMISWVKSWRFLVISCGYGGSQANFHLVAWLFGKIANSHGHEGQAVLGQMFLETQEQLNEAVFSGSHLIRRHKGLQEIGLIVPAAAKCSAGFETLITSPEGAVDPGECLQELRRICGWPDF